MGYFVALAFIIILSYLGLILFIIHQWQSQAQVKSETQRSAADLSLSIIIPARNEEQNILRCLNSIMENESFDIINPQIIVIDDFSEDATAEMVQSINHPNVELISMFELDLSIKNAFKKSALRQGLKIAKGDYIVQMDADTWVGPNYLTGILRSIARTNAAFIVGPVVLNGATKLLEHFQQLDFIGMMGVTQAGIKSGKWFMANGANMIYKNGLIDYTDSSLASGDDIYSVQKAAASGAEIEYLKSEDSIVYTHVVKNINGFYQQRIRWATKNKLMKSGSMVVMMLIPFLNACLWFSYIPLAIFFPTEILFVLITVHLLIQLSVDYIYLREMNRFFKLKDSMSYFFQAKVLHTIYIAFIGLTSLFVKKYSWKGRVVE